MVDQIKEEINDDDVRKNINDFHYVADIDMT